jgi:DNA-binding NarL/FixJ family response regulator
VLLAEDHPITREGIRGLLQKSIDIDLVGEAPDGAEALRMAQELAPDVLLLDMEMPGFTGVEVAKRLQEAGSSVRVLALSAHSDKEYIWGLLSNGAAGYLMKEEAPHSIVEAVRGVARGEQGWVSRQVAAQMASWALTENDRTALTEREIQVLKLVVEGKTNGEIGLGLGISEKTVEKHLEGVYSKLGVASRVEAAVLAVRSGLV